MLQLILQSARHAYIRLYLSVAGELDGSVCRSVEHPSRCTPSMQSSETSQNRTNGTMQKVFQIMVIQPHQTDDVVRGEPGKMGV